MIKSMTRGSISNTINYRSMLAGNAGFALGYLTRLKASTNLQANGVTFDASGNAYVCGYLYNSGGGYNGIITKLDTNGIAVWSRTLTDSLAAASQADMIQAAAVDASGNVFVCGRFKNASGGQNGFIAKYDSTGAIQWQKYNADPLAAASQGTTFVGIKVDGSGNIYAGGTTRDASNNVEMLFTKWDSTGTIVWQRASSGGTNTGAGQAFHLDASGNSYMAGYGNSGAYGFVVKYDTSGTLQWQQKTSSTGGYDQTAGIATDSAGNVYLIGSSRTTTPTTSDRALLVKYNSAGTSQWQRGLSDAGTQFNAISIDASDNIFLYGANSAGPIYIKADTSGNLVYQGAITSTSTGIAGNPSSRIIDGLGNIGFVMSEYASATTEIMTKFPNSAVKTGTFTVDGISYTYATGTTTWITPTVTLAAASFTFGTPTNTTGASTLTDAAFSPTVVRTGI